MSLAQQAECIDASIRNDWQGLFPEKVVPQKAAPPAHMMEYLA